MAITSDTDLLMKSEYCS